MGGNIRATFQILTWPFFAKKFLLSSLELQLRAIFLTRREHGAMTQNDFQSVSLWGFRFGFQTLCASQRGRKLCSEKCDNAFPLFHVAINTFKTTWRIEMKQHQKWRFSGNNFTAKNKEVGEEDEFSEWTRNWAIHSFILWEARTRTASGRWLCFRMYMLKKRKKT